MKKNIFLKKTRHCDLLFSEDLPLFSSLGSFELGILAPGDGEGSREDEVTSKEVDIDSAIRKASAGGGAAKDAADAVSETKAAAAAVTTVAPERPRSIAIVVGHHHRSCADESEQSPKYKFLKFAI